MDYNWKNAALFGPVGGFFGGKKKKQPSFEFQPYSGARPQQPEFLRPTEKLTYDTLSRRSQGQDVGYDPQRRELLTGLVKSELKTAQDRDLRDASGRLASSGLSGNPRAYEAIAGRVNQDYSTKLGNELSRIAIEDLGRANEERDINTARLADFNRFNFGQSNTAANFDLDVYGAEQGNRLNAANFQQGQNQYEQSRRDQQLSELGQFGISAASLAMGNPAPLVMQGAQTLNQPGTGIAPQSSPYVQPLNRTRAYRNLVR